MRSPHTLLLIVTISAVLLVGCGLEQANGYVQSADGSLSFRHPNRWSEVDVAPAGLEWVVAVDASSNPTADHLAEFAQPDPFLLAQVLPLVPDARATASLDFLRTLALAGQGDPATVDNPAIRLLFHDEIVDEHGFEGHHMRFEVDLDGDTATTEHLAVFDPGRLRVHRLVVSCSVVCFEANADQIDEIFSSVRFRE